jgi:3-hydroxyisobutyrate dehydrogenase-like beta-hydroxyacid dehydrogenase
MARRGAHISSDANDVARYAEIVLTCLPTEEAVAQVYEDLVPTARPGQIYVDHSTVSIELSRHCAAQLANCGAAFLDAPVSGGPEGARAGTLTVMDGGEQAVFERALPVFQAYGATIRLCGPTGLGQAVKLVNQLLTGINTAAVAEAAILGQKLGVELSVLLEVIATSYGSSTMLSRNLPRFIDRDFQPGGTINTLLKDLGIIRQEAERHGAVLLLGSLAEQRFLAARYRGWGQEDLAAVVKLWEEDAGMAEAGDDVEPG